MSYKDQMIALEKVARARKKILEHHQQLLMQYNDRIKKKATRRDSIMKKRRKEKNNLNSDRLWNRLQNLPIEERLNWESKLGLDKSLPSEKRRHLRKRFDSLLYSEQDAILNQIQ